VFSMKSIVFTLLTIPFYVWPSNTSLIFHCIKDASCSKLLASLLLELLNITWVLEEFVN
jgi:hypothetical protein